MQPLPFLARGESHHQWCDDAANHSGGRDTNRSGGRDRRDGPTHAHAHARVRL